MPKIFINAGHGGIDPGAVSKNGIKEKDITKQVGAFLASMLIEKGFDVEFFQQKKALKEVIEAENRSKSHLFISLHCNSAKNEAANGVEIYHYPNSGTGKALAEWISYELASYLELKNRGAKEANNFLVLNSTYAPAILIELAFLSNEKEEKLLTSEPYSFAKVIADKIERVWKW